MKKIRKTIRVIGLMAIFLALMFQLAFAQEPIKTPVVPPVDPKELQKPIPELLQPDLVVTRFTTTGSATIDAVRNSLTVPISITVRNQGAGRAGTFPIHITITAPDGRIVWSGSPNLTNTVRDGAGNICTTTPLPAEASRVFTGRLAATISPTILRLTRGMIVSLQVFIDAPPPPDFGPECGPVRETNEGNNTSAPLRVTLR